jgi:serine/threonine protein kinase
MLHRYQIVHGDVNCSNLMFSPTFGKNVLIDFGFSEGLKEECGYKTFTSFRGTPKYVSPEMLKLFSIECKLSFVDLYYNDLVCFHNARRYFSDTASK